MVQPAFVTARRIQEKLTTDSSGDGSATIDVSGELRMVKMYCSTTGAYCSVVELVQGESLTLSGDTLAEGIITANSTIRPYVNKVDVTGSSLGDTTVTSPVIDLVKVTVASGGDTKAANFYLYMV